MKSQQGCVCVMAIFLVVGACSPAPDGEQTSAPNGDGNGDAASIMEAVNAKYAEIFDEARKVTLKQVTTTRRPDSPEVKTTSTAVIHQQGPKARFEILPDARVERAALGEVPAFEGLSHKRHVWVHDTDANQTHGIHEGMGGEEDVKAFRVDGTQLHESFQSHLRHDEIPAELVAAPHTLTKTELMGRPSLLIESVERVSLHPRTEVKVKLWVDEETKLIEKLDVMMWHTQDRDGEPETIEIETQYEVDYEFGAAIPAGHFELELPEGHEDWTPSAVEGTNAILRARE